MREDGLRDQYKLQIVVSKLISKSMYIPGALFFLLCLGNYDT